jgi:outer membrane protein OmpA-like peptidoglycan-associated protein
MRGRLLLLAILLVVGAAGLVASGTVKLPWNLAALDPVPSVPKPSAPESAHSKQDAKSVIEETTAALGLNGKDVADPADKPVLDVSRISRDGVSVFAGRAKPNSYVTLLEDGKPAGTAKTDDSGSFSLSTEHKFASLDPKLTFRTDANPPPAPAPAQTASIAPANKIKASASPTAEVMQKFEGLVAEAREHAKAEAERAKSESAASSAAKSSSSDTSSSSETATVTVQAAPDNQAVARNDAPQVGVSANTERPRTIGNEPIPVPIMFVYNEAELTPEGQRGVGLLLEYVKLERLPSIELSGHADERGTDEYNMDLSRERLETVQRILREGGYDGQLKLSPKGKSEPFTGVDRTMFTQEALFQLDRRVELHIVR